MDHLPSLMVAGEGLIDDLAGEAEEETLDDLTLVSLVAAEAPDQLDCAKI